MRKYKYIGASIGNCAGTVGCQDAPKSIESVVNNEEWKSIIEFSGDARRLDAIDELEVFSTKLAFEVSEVVLNNQKFVVVGGDHSCAIGTWSGVSSIVEEYGLIWIDAHMDSHTPESSPSGNLHGTPVASLLGRGSDKLTSILSKNNKIKPENIVLIGIRSYEEAEEKLLNELGVRIIKMDEVIEKGFVNCFNEILALFKSKEINFGISFDLDGLDPSEISAVGTPVENGIKLKDIFVAFNSINFNNLIGIEIVEYNPRLDKKNEGVKIIKSIIEKLKELKL